MLTPIFKKPSVVHNNIRIKKPEMPEIKFYFFFHVREIVY